MCVSDLWLRETRDTVRGERQFESELMTRVSEVLFSVFMDLFMVHVVVVVDCLCVCV